MNMYGKSMNEQMSSPNQHVIYHKQITFPIIHCNAKVTIFSNVSLRHSSQMTRI